MSINIIKESFSVNLRIMRILALYPPKSYKILFRILRYIFYFLFIVPTPLLQCLYLFSQEKLTFKQIVDNTFLIAELGCLIPKYWTFLNNGERMKKCVQFFSAPEFEISKISQKHIRDDCIKTCRMATIIFLVAVSSGYMSWSSRPVSWKGHIFPTDLWLPFDPVTAPRLYNIVVYAYLVVAVGYAAYANAVVDPLSAGLAYQATTQLRVLKDNLQHLDKYLDADGASYYSTKERNKFRYRKVKECVVHHNRILEFVKEYQICFSQVAFSQFAGGVIILCVSCLQLTLVDVLSFDFLAMIMFLISMLAEVYVYCHFGTILYEESNTLNDAIYLSNWYEYDIKTKRTLMILMERAKRPITVTCGKIFDMSFVTFGLIIRRSYSLLAVLENYNIDFN